MDSHYSSNVVNNTSASTYSSTVGINGVNGVNGISSSLPPHSLPPLQPAMQSLYGSHPHTPRTPGTPNTPGSNSTVSTYPPTSQPAVSRGPYQIMSNPYQPHQSYATSSSMLSQSSAAVVSHPQPIAPAPATARPSPVGAPALRPLAAGGVMPQSSMGYGQGPLAGQPSLLQDGEQPTHVVGSQGRRGILPSAPGRPQPPPAGTASAKNTVPVKDADGKYPCPHCTKTYLHAKHLKRHLLRHTGDRPYMCVLCRDTFSRSDILKRHFQKCSIRRGNPTGASHLSHPMSHVKNQKALIEKTMRENPPQPIDPTQINGLLRDDNSVHPFDQAMIATDPNRERRQYSSDVPTTMTQSMSSQMASYNMPQGQNGVPIFAGASSNQQSALDWAQMFPAGAQQTYINAFPPNIGQNQNAMKQELSHLDSASAGADRPPFFTNLGMQPSDPYQQLSARIIRFLYPHSILSNQAPSLNVYFSANNIKDFLLRYTHFHAHFSIIHFPTFRTTDAYVGLVAAMCCIGACYSNLVSSAQVREMMKYLRWALQQDSRILRYFNNVPEIKSENLSFGEKKNDIEELQALMLMQNLFLWHGSPEHREIARQTFPLIAKIARESDLLTVSNRLSLYSPLHQSDFNPQNFDIASFDWTAWVEQEKRLRIMYIVYLCDAALGLYFNSPAQFDCFEIRLPLPADDAAWDARTPAECTEALGLHGSEAAKARNPDGTQRSKQPEFDLALRALLHHSYQIQPGATNLYGKFILIHALLAQLRHAQSSDGQLIISNGGTIHLSQNDWITRGSDGTGSANTSGRGTPVDSGYTYTVPNIINAMEKFKINWDHDMLTQFPPSTTANPRRYGFSRDAIHFYWVAKYLAKHSQPGELQVPAEQRFKYIMALLKSVKAWVVSDAATRGEEIGSVGDIDKDYGVADLTFDITRLFTPLGGVAGTTPAASELGNSAGSLI